MARIPNPEADALLDETVPVLDKGFVRLVDYLGGDARIVQAARVSYGDGTKSVREDRALIDYLVRNKHTSPLEMVELTFHVKAPIFVARQWLRHRTACLAGEAELYFDEPAAVAKGRRKLRKMSIAEFHRKWTEGFVQHNGPRTTGPVAPERIYSVPELARVVGQREESIRNLVRQGDLEATRRPAESPTSPSIFVRGSDWLTYAGRRIATRKPMRGRLKRMHLRMCDERTGEIVHTHVRDVWQSGMKPVFAVTLENGYRLEMTADHRCLTEEGWMTLGQASALRLRDDGGVTWRGDAPALAVNGVRPHADPSWLSARRAEGLSVSEIAERANVSYHTIRKHLKLHGLQYSSRERARLSGRSQRGQRRTVRRGPLSSQAREAIRAARSGDRSNFWKGGVSSERANIGRWTREQASRVHRRWDHTCALCGADRELQTHHIDPVWHKPVRAKDTTNLMTVCRPCHQRLHGRNLALHLLDWQQRGRDLTAFWSAHPDAAPAPATRPTPKPTRLVRTFSPIASIEYVGEVMTFDLEVEGPYHNFVANGFIVHNSVNEISARYSVMRDEFYMPEPEQVRAQGKRSRQVGEGDVPEAVATEAAQAFEESQMRSYHTYEDLLEKGVAREMAREVLPVGLYTEFYWKQDLHNLLHFLRLRMDWHAQYEIRAYGDAMATMVRAVAPMAYEAFEEHILHARSFARSELELLRAAVDPERLAAALEASDLRKSRRREFRQKLGLDAADDG